MKRKAVLLSILFYLVMSISFSCFAEEIKEVRDISFKCKHGSCPSDFYQLNDISFFIAKDGDSGRELWRTDGMERGTFLVKDINPGKYDSKIIPMGVMDEIFYFSADNGRSGRDLWRSDGTEKGTFLVKDTTFDIEMKNEGCAIMGDDHFYFFAESSFWVSDGTARGTIMLEGPEFYSGSDLNLLDDVVYFRSSGKLWKSDSALNPPVIVSDPDTKKTFPWVSGLVRKGSALYFSAKDENGISSLYKSDGTYRGSTIISTIGIRKDDRIERMHIVKGMIYLEAVVEDTLKIFRSDGTKEGTILIEEGVLIHSDLTFNKGNVYFKGEDSENGFGLWISDGTPDGTMMLRKIDSPGITYDPLYITPFQNLIYYVESNQESTELWKSDGTEKGTSQVLSFNHRKGIKRLFALENKLIFCGKDWNKGEELWQTDGTLDGTRLLKDIRPDSFGSSPIIFYGSDERIFFSSYDTAHGRELWVSDGTIKGTRLVKDIHPGPKSSFDIYNHKTLFKKGILYFIADDGIHGKELWRSDGTFEGTYMVKDISKGAGSFLSVDALDKRDKGKISKKAEALNKREVEISYLFSSSFPFFFIGDDGIHGQELWISDGTENGTRMVKDINKGPDGTGFWRGICHKDRLFFWADTGTKAFKIWVSDGTDKGTHPISDFSPFLLDNRFNLKIIDMAGDDLYVATYSKNELNETEGKLWRINTLDNETSFLHDLCFGITCHYEEIEVTFGMERLLYYQWSYDEGGYEFWRSDGSKKGTFILTQDAFGLGFTNLSEKKGQMWGMNYYPYKSLELWKSDGTKKGTVMFKKISIPKEDYLGYPGRFFELNGKTYFFLNHVNYNNNSRTLTSQLWQSDGSASGTIQTAEIIVEDGKSGPIDDIVSGNTIYTSILKRNLKQAELWRSDSTQKGTSRVKRFDTPGNYHGSRGLHSLTSSNGHIFFIIYDGYLGSELWRSDGTEKGTFRITGENLNSKVGSSHYAMP